MLPIAAVSTATPTRQSEAADRRRSG